MGFNCRGRCQAPWGVPIPNCLCFRKGSKSDLAGCSNRWLRKFGPYHPNEYGSDGPPPLSRQTNRWVRHSPLRRAGPEVAVAWVCSQASRVWRKCGWSVQLRAVSVVHPPASALNRRGPLRTKHTLHNITLVNSKRELTIQFA